MKYLFAAITFLAFTNVAFAADELRPLKDWTPKGWKIAMEAAGDLNGDGIQDAALIFEENDPGKIKKNTGLGTDPLNTNGRVIVVLFGKDGLFRKISQSTTLVPPQGDEETPCLADPLSDLKIRNGTLKLTLTEWLSCGSWGVASHIYTFRYDGTGMQLIGEDESSFMRNTGEKSEISTNYLTGKRKTTSGLNEFGKSHPKTSWETLKKEPPQYLERF